MTDRLRKQEVPEDADYQLWTIRSMNPDGAARGNRYNARRVDLNHQLPGHLVLESVPVGPWAGQSRRPARHDAVPQATQAHWCAEFPPAVGHQCSVCVTSGRPTGSVAPRN